MQEIEKKKVRKHRPRKKQDRNQTMQNQNQFTQEQFNEELERRVREEMRKRMMEEPRSSTEVAMPQQAPAQEQAPQTPMYQTDAIYSSPSQPSNYIPQSMLINNAPTNDAQVDFSAQLPQAEDVPTITPAQTPTEQAAPAQWATQQDLDRASYQMPLNEAAPQTNQYTVQTDVHAPRSNEGMGEAFLTEEDRQARINEKQLKRALENADTEGSSEQVASEEAPSLFGGKKKKQKKSKRGKAKKNEEVERPERPQRDRDENKKNKKEVSKSKKTLKSVKVPRSVQESIPYISVYKNGIIEIEHGFYTKSYKIKDVEFNQASGQEQEVIFMNYVDFLNQIDPTIKMEVTVFNRTIDMEQFKEEVLFAAQDDEYNLYREDYNRIIMDKASRAQNNIRREKYITLTIEADGIEQANETFNRVDTLISNALKKICGEETDPMSIEDRLEILYMIYNQGSKYPFMKEIIDVSGNKISSFSLDLCKKYGIQTKDCIGPSSMEFKRDYFCVNEKYGRTLFLSQLPTILRANILSELSSLPITMLTSVHYYSLPQDKAMKMVRHQNLNIDANLIDAQKRAAKSGYSGELVSPELRSSKEEANRILEDITIRNQKLFFATIVITVFADSPKELKRVTKDIESIAMKHICQIKTLNWQQEYGFDTSLPLGYNRIFTERLLTTESAAIFLPYASQELVQKHGFYYGINPDSKGLILFNRTNSKNANGVILGTPGSGKSFSAKREMLNVLLNTGDDLYIIDPEREYAPMAEKFGGEVIRIAPGSKVYINPMDMDLQYADDDDPVRLKADFINSLCESAVGGRLGLSPIQQTIIDRCVQALYKDYIEQLDSMNVGKDKSQMVTFDAELCPTLTDFYNELLAQNEPEAKNIALALERYVTGSLDTFAKKTNVQIHKRFVVYDIKDMGLGLREMGLRICLNDIWNKIITNRKKGKRTWFYIDEFYLLTQTDSSARFLQEIWKRARKWSGIPTGITQNVADLLASHEARTILSDSDFVLMLNQAPLDKRELAAMFNMSSTMQENITNAGPGKGLIYTGNTIIPFIDEFPSDNMLYPILTTKPSEMQ